MPRRKKDDAIRAAVTGQFERVRLDEHLMAGFVETFLQEDFDSPKPSPEFHRELWRLFTSLAPKVVIAAPRGHAKSTAGTFAFGLASALFGNDDFVLIVSATEALAAAHLANIARVIDENEDMKTEFDLAVVKSNETELVVRCGSREFCLVGKGAEQKVRGILWRNKRPSLILVDDLEDDEAVMSKDRREKLRNWFFNALLPVGSDRIRVRFVGTVLHLDSLLERLLNDEQWVARRFSAHKSYDNFTEILWPEQFPVERLLSIRAQYNSVGNPSGYSQEYLNRPVADADAYFRKADFVPMQDEDYKSPKIYYGSIDFALGKDEKADNTCLLVAGLDPAGLLHIVHVVAERMDSAQAVDKMFELQSLYGIDSWVVEDENIAKAVGPFLDIEMVRRNVFMNLLKLRPHKDKQKRATSIKARMRAKGVRFDWDADWFPGFQGEVLVFPRGKHDDRVDALSGIGLLMDKFYASPTQQQLDERAWEAEREESGAFEEGRSVTTGY